MSKVVLEASTRLWLDSLRKKLPHAVLLHGPVGVGLSSAASYVLHDLPGDVITVLPEKNDTVDVEKGTITVKIIRKLYDMARSKGSKKYIVIDYAERMAKPAQNAFLKLLEEPNDSVYFVLLSHEPQLFLPTILSRVQPVGVKPISLRQSEDFLDSLGVKSEDKRRQLLFVAVGLPAELTRLQDDSCFESRSGTVRDARSYITGSPYERSVIAHRYRDDRSRAISLLDDILKLLKMTAESKKDPSLVDSMEKVMKTRDRVVGNGNIRLQLAVAL